MNANQWKVIGIGDVESIVYTLEKYEDVGHPDARQAAIFANLRILSNHFFEQPITYALYSQWRDIILSREADDERQAVLVPVYNGIMVGNQFDINAISTGLMTIENACEIDPALDVLERRVYAREEL